MGNDQVDIGTPIFDELLADLFRRHPAGFWPDYFLWWVVVADRIATLVAAQLMDVLGIPVGG